MEVVLVFNGLGNQMSQYAFYLSKKKVCPNTKCLYYSDNRINQHNGLELTNVFGITDIYRSGSLLGILYGFSKESLRKKGKRRVFGKMICKLFGVNVILENPNYDYDYGMLEKHDGFINFYYGGWHSEKYYQPIRDSIFLKYKFPKVNSALSDLVKSVNSVSIHIRRGDYVGTPFDGICSEDYYKTAIAYFKELIPSSLHFFIFSDDVQWVKSKFEGNDYTVVEANNGDNSWKDMLLMSQCKHNIIANSTFSWWAAYLNMNRGKIVVCPNRFINAMITKDIFPSDWLTYKELRDK